MTPNSILPSPATPAHWRAVAERVSEQATGAEPGAALDLLRESGLAALTIPREHGGTGAHPSLGTEVVQTLAKNNDVLARILADHFRTLTLLVTTAASGERCPWLTRSAAEQWIWALAEPAPDAPILTPTGDGNFNLDGRALLGPGAAAGDVMLVSARTAHGFHTIILEHGRPGTHYLGDWDNCASRLTSTGPIRFAEVHVTPGDLIGTTHSDNTLDAAAEANPRIDLRCTPSVSPAITRRAARGVTLHDPSDYRRLEPGTASGTGFLLPLTTYITKG
ncbi:hypothetical protein D9V32_08725 [Mycetocola tolaasinivorans]|uniref:Acyl-CoA dehydrogenase n=1 Tax=Mycetocola tolaasinivorans TaxID=76635 RepID=A0A3L7A7K0_9MICO|nr:hypothetical protein [Mycetocola tolaasinivorans]RLP75551.1 hypothetical protein D9V32_08725 [Mycetocola tolaasinivorans]